MIIFCIFLFLLTFFFLCHLLLTPFCFFFAVNICSSTFFKMFFFISAEILPLFFLLPRFLLFLPFSYFLMINLIFSDFFHSFSFLLFLSHTLGAMSDWLSKKRIYYTKEASTMCGTITGFVSRPLLIFIITVILLPSPNNSLLPILDKLVKMGYFAIYLLNQASTHPQIIMNM